MTGRAFGPVGEQPAGHRLGLGSGVDDRELNSIIRVGRGGSACVPGTTAPGAAVRSSNRISPPPGAGSVADAGRRRWYDSKMTEPHPGSPGRSRPSSGAAAADVVYVNVNEARPTGDGDTCLRSLGLCELGGCCDSCWYRPDHPRFRNRH